MTINDDNKEEVFEGLLHKRYNLDELRAIKATFDQDQELYKAFQFHKLTHQGIAEASRQKLKEELQVQGVTFKPETPLMRLWRAAPVAVAASILLCLGTGMLLYNSQSNSSLSAQEVEINYQEIAPNSLGLAGVSDTLVRRKTILIFPSDLEASYLFKNDTLVLYGTFEHTHLMYIHNLQTDQRHLWIDNIRKELQYVNKKTKM
jgi:hypothetical protein